MHPFLEDRSSASKQSSSRQSPTKRSNTPRKSYSREFLHRVTDSFNKLTSPLASQSTSRSNSTTSLNNHFQAHDSHHHDALNNFLSVSIKKLLDTTHSDSSTASNATTMGTTPSLNKDEKLYFDKELDSTASLNKVKETNHVFLEYDPVSKRKKLNTYELLKDLGRGQHGKVKLARDTTTNALVAIKIVDRKSKPSLGKVHTNTEEKVKREIAIMKKCDHPHVVKLIEVLDDATSRKIYMVLEYLEKGEIKWSKKDEVTGELRPYLKFHEARQVFRDVVSGLEYLHYQGVIHRDIKPGNLLVSQSNIVKISDFGISYASSLESNTEYELAKTAGTPAFMAPELCSTNGYKPDTKVTHKIDIWALGVTLYCLLFGTLPFYGDSEYLLFEAINKEKLKFPPAHKSYMTDEEFEMSRDLLEKLLRKDPEKRIDIPDIKQHKFFTWGLSRVDSKLYSSNFNCNKKIAVSNEEVDDAVIGIRNRIKHKLQKALKLAGLSSVSGSSTASNSSSQIKVTRKSQPRPSSHIKFLSMETSQNEPVLSEVQKDPETIVPITSWPPASHYKRDSISASILSKERSGSIDSSSTAPVETRALANGDVYVDCNPRAVSHLSTIVSKDMERRLSVMSNSNGSTHGTNNAAPTEPVDMVFSRSNIPTDQGASAGAMNVPESSSDDSLDCFDGSPPSFHPIDNNAETNSLHSASSKSILSVPEDLKAFALESSHGRGRINNKFSFGEDVSSSQSSDSDSSAHSESEEEDDDGELTLVLGPKREMPPFLRRRIASHESTLPTVGNMPKEQATKNVDQDIANACSPVHSSSDIARSELDPFVMFNTENNHVEVQQPTKERATRAHVVSPLSKDAPLSPKANTSAHLAPKISYNPRLYRNHYSKEFFVTPYQSDAFHYNADEKRSNQIPSATTSSQNDNTDRYRSRNNSITVGILQRGNSKDDSI
ncbi:BA75_02519T0 [Komagataella pastoris]|uniref:non-specific serine/threonine protein kinase n=1 Tax=Komagataella pastoris TaxID=4922 RepID=A0A1B2JB01_PICPA|nr:BA75_02519T0 [Komagataella pastoris]